MLRSRDRWRELARKLRGKRARTRGFVQEKIGEPRRSLSLSLQVKV
jgi:hypothetical protein